MSSVSNLHRRLLDASFNNDVSGVRQSYIDWQIANCYNPKYVNTYDAHLQITRTMRVPCGRCYHCIESKINEWVTRMYAHLEDFKNVYFVTLTYRSFNNVTNSVNQLLINKLTDAVWHYDSLNERKTLGFNPCLLCKSHYQNFLKRLRKNTGVNDLSYVLSGEYGTKYGRPHFHMILFTNHTLTYNDIRRAWSVSLFHRDSGEWIYRKNHKLNGTAYDFPIGRVDFHDLVSNGTVNTAQKIKIDGRFMNASNCFSYVCKYVCKRDNANLSRVKLAYNSLFKKVKYTKVFDKDIEWLHIRNYLIEYGYPYEVIDKQINVLKKYCYEKIIFQPDSAVYSFGLLPTKSVNFFGTSATLDVFPSKIGDFILFFVPFCEFSRGCPIGSLYAKRHLQEFAKGVYNKPLLQDSSFVVPSYFRYKERVNYYGLRKCNQTIKSKSYSLGGLELLYRRFKNALENNVPLRECIDTKFNLTSFTHALQTDYLHFADLSRGTKVVLADGYAVHFKYNKHFRKYFQVNRQPLKEWLSYWVSRLELEFDRHDVDLIRAADNEFHYHQSLDIISNLGMSYSALHDSVIQSQEDYRKEKQRIYDSCHKSVE